MDGSVGCEISITVYVLVRYYYIVRFPGEGENDEEKRLAFLII